MPKDSAMRYLRSFIQNGRGMLNSDLSMAHAQTTVDNGGDLLPLVVNELLSFVTFKLNWMPADSIQQLCLNYYDDNAIEQAKARLFELCAQADDRQDRYIKRTGDTKSRRNMEDIIGLATRKSGSMPVTFVSMDLANLPAVSFNSIDVSSLLVKMENVRMELDLLKTTVAVQAVVCGDLQTAVAGQSAVGSHLQEAMAGLLDRQSEAGAPEWPRLNANNATPARRRTHATPPVTGGAETAPGLAVDGEHPDADAGRDDLTAGHADTGHANDNGAHARGVNSDERARDNGGRAGDNGARARDNGARARDNGARPRDNGGRPRDNSGRARGNGARAHDNGARAHDNGARARDNIRDDSDGAWTRVTRKERKPSSRKRAGVIGCAKELPIRAAKNAMLRYANVFVSRLDPDLSACDLEEYLVGRLNIEVNVETVKATEYLSTFHVTSQCRQPEVFMSADRKAHMCVGGGKAPSAHKTYKL